MTRQRAEYRAENKTRIRETRKAWDRKIRAETLQHYGGYCKCCKEQIQDFLTIWQREGDKAPEGQSVFYWLRKRGWPAGYIVLCFNCSGARKRGGFCPHEDHAI